MADVFLSYARADEAFVRRIAQAITREGYSVWWDDELPAHVAYGSMIAEKIAASKVLLVLWSPNSTASEWVRGEAEMARSQKKLVQASIAEAQLPLPFNMFQSADLTGWKGGKDHPGWRRVRASLAELCGAAGGDATSPVPDAQPRDNPQAATERPPVPETLSPYNERKARSWPMVAVALVVVIGLVAIFASRNADEVTVASADGNLAADSSVTMNELTEALSGLQLPTGSGNTAGIESILQDAVNALDSSDATGPDTGANSITDLVGTWSLSWAPASGPRTARLMFIDGGALLDVRYGGNRVMQECEIRRDGADAEIRCRNPLIVSGNVTDIPEAFAVRITGSRELSGRTITSSGATSTPVTFSRIM